jgi:hypothetical protein
VTGIRFATTLLVLSALPAPARAEEAPGRVLPAAASATVWAWMGAPSERAPLPEGWEIAGVSVDDQEISLDLAGPDGATADVRLHPQGVPGARRGQWFGISVAVPPGPWGDAPFLALGVDLDDAFAEDPWEDADEIARSSTVVEWWHGGDRGFDFPRWAVEGIGLANVAFLVGLVIWVLAMGLRSERSGPHGGGG